MDYEKPKKTEYAYDYFIEALIEAGKKSYNSKYKKYIDKLEKIDREASQTRKQSPEDYNVRIHKTTKKIRQVLEDIEKKSGQKLLIAAAREARYASVPYDSVLIGANKYDATVNIPSVVAYDFQYRYLKKIEKKVEVVAEKPKKEKSTPTTPTYPGAKISFAESRQIAKEQDVVEYFLANLKGRQFVRHINNIRAELNKNPDQSDMKKVRHKVKKELNKIISKDNKMVLTELLAKINTIYSKYCTTREDFINQMHYEIMAKIAEKKDVKKVDNQDEPKTTITQYHEPEAEKQGEVKETPINISNWQEQAAEKKKYDELYEKGQYKPLNEHEYGYNTAEREIVRIMNHYYNRHFDETPTKSDIEYLGVRNLFQLAQELADDIFDSTVLNATVSYAERESKIRSTYHLYSLKERMIKFNKYQKKFMDFLNKQSLDLKERVIAEIALESKKKGITPTEQGIYKNVAVREKKFLINNAKDQIYQGIIYSAIATNKKYDLKAIPVHVPVEEIPAVYLDIVNQIKYGYYFNEARDLAQAARMNGRIKEAEEHEVKAAENDRVHEERKAQALNILQREFSAIIFKKVSKIEAKTNEKETLFLAEICRKYLNEEPRFLDQKSNIASINDLEAKKRLEEAQAKWQKSSTKEKVVLALSGKKRNMDEIISEINKEDENISNLGM